MNKAKSLGQLSKNNHQQPSSGFKWRSMLALALMYVIVFFDMQWVWGILFLLWVIPDLRSGTTYFLEPVQRSSNPLEYWAIVGSWIIMSLLSFSTLFIDYDTLVY